LIDSQAEAAQQIALPLASITGTVTLARRPLSARLLFGGRSGAEKINTTADDEGKFSVTLPRAGKWVVDVEAKTEGVLAAIPVTVAEDDELTIELPDTEIAGHVTGPDGSPAGKAVVTLLTTAGVVERRAEPDATFRFRGVLPGATSLFATDRMTREQSRVIDLQIAAGTRAENIELTLQQQQTIKGLVMAAGQPVIGARITGYGFLDGRASAQSTISGVDGGFTLSFPASASEIVFITAAAGRTLQAFRAAAQDQVRLDIAPVGGLLRLRTASGFTGQEITYNGIFVPMGDLVTWARAQGKPTTSPLEIPSLAPGNYRYCARHTSGAQTCRTGTLARGGTLELMLEEPGKEHP
jgi:hypothetical protein